MNTDTKRKLVQIHLQCDSPSHELQPVRDTLPPAVAQQSQVSVPAPPQQAAPQHEPLQPQQCQPQAQNLAAMDIDDDSLMLPTSQIPAVSHHAYNDNNLVFPTFAAQSNNMNMMPNVAAYPNYAAPAQSVISPPVQQHFIPTLIPPKRKVATMSDLKQFALDVVDLQNRSPGFVGPKQAHGVLNINSQGSYINYLSILKCMEQKNRDAIMVRYTFDATSSTMPISKYAKEHLGFPGGLTKLYNATPIGAQYIPHLRWLGLEQ